MSDETNSAVVEQVHLYGCRAEPLASYLKSVGILRLVSEQADPLARGHFEGDHFVLTTMLGLDDLIDFLVERYEPTPVINPWNKGSGFAPDDASKSPTAFAAVSTIRLSVLPRLATYRAAIEAALEISGTPGWGEVPKEQQVAVFRSNLPDEAIEWLDAAVVLTTQSRSFPPLLGTGGNDGRLDFGSVFMRRIIDLFALGQKQAPENTRRLAADALNGTATGHMSAESLGQFDPSGAGGPASGASGSAAAVSNPWDSVLLFEGAVAFVSGAARRFGASADVASMPFMVQATMAGYGAAAAERSRGEFWAPLWRRPTGAREVLRLISEGRTEFKGRQARTGVDVARALASYGVDRGIDEFVRYAFLERNGLATFAVPVGRMRVQLSERVQLLGTVDPWLNRFRSGNGSALAEAAVRQVDAAMIRLSQSNDQRDLRRVLTTLAELERLARRSRQMNKSVGRPLSGLYADQWVPNLDDGSPEFAVACALASLRCRGSRASLIKRLVIGNEWEATRPAVAGFGRVPLTVLARSLIDRIAIDATVDRFDSTASAAWCGDVVADPCAAQVWADLASGHLDLVEIEEWLLPLMQLSWRRAPVMPTGQQLLALDSVPAALAVVKACFHHANPRSALSARPVIASRRASRSFATNDTSAVVDECLRTLRIASVEVIPTSTQLVLDASSVEWMALAALVPVTHGVVSRLTRMISRDSDDSAEREQPTSIEQPEGVPT